MVIFLGGGRPELLPGCELSFFFAIFGSLQGRFTTEGSSKRLSAPGGSWERGNCIVRILTYSQGQAM